MLNSYVHAFRLLTIWGLYSFVWFLKFPNIGFLILTLFCLASGVFGWLGDYRSKKKSLIIRNWENETSTGILCILCWVVSLFIPIFNRDIMLFFLKSINPLLVYGVFTLIMVRYHKLPKTKKKRINSQVESTKKNLETHFLNFERLKEIPKIIEKKEFELEEIKNMLNHSDSSMKEKFLEKEIKTLRKELKVIKKKYNINNF